jgi:hypothetical protein
MNTGACDCCDDPFIAVDPIFRCEPVLELRFRTIERSKCGYNVGGVAYKETEQEFECRDDPFGILWTTTRKDAITKTGEYFDPEQFTAIGTYCSVTTTYDPPTSSSPPLCQCCIPFQAISELIGLNEYTDEELRGDILNILQNAPYFPEGGGFQANQPAMGTYTADSFTGYGEQTQYRISHRAIPSCYLKVWIGLQTYEYPSIGNFGSLLNDSNQIYIWQPSSSPCLPDPTKSAQDDAQIIKSEIYSVDPDETNKITCAFIRKYSFLPDYEPDDPIVVNPFDISRPDPDCNPNGVPNPNSGC